MKPQQMVVVVAGAGPPSPPETGAMRRPVTTSRTRTQSKVDQWRRSVGGGAAATWEHRENAIALRPWWMVFCAHSREDKVKEKAYDTVDIAAAGGEGVMSARDVL